LDAVAAGKVPDSKPLPQTTFAKHPSSAEAGATFEARRAKEEIWDALLKNLGAKKKTVLLLGLLSQMKGRREGDELVITSPHQFVLDRLREEDKWPVLLQAVAEVAGKRLEVRLSVSGEKKSHEAGPVGKGEDRPEKRALSDPLLTEVLREFEGATVLEIRQSPGKEAAPAGQEPEEPAPEEEAEGG
jgi:hypothetical protein